MKSLQNTGRIVLLFAIVAVLAIVILMTQTAKGGVSAQDEGKGTLADYSEALKTELQLKDEMGSDAVLPELYRIQKGQQILGDSDKEALDEAKDSLIRKRGSLRICSKERF